MVAAVALLAGSLLLPLIQTIITVKPNWPGDKIIRAFRSLYIGDNLGVESVEKPPRGYSRQVKAHHHPVLLIEPWKPSVIAS